MIKKVTDKASVTKLWREAFGDSESEISFFLDNAEYDCFGYYKKGQLVSMLFVLSCMLNNQTSYYIYAACTREEFRCLGLMTELIDYCKQQYSSICLIPANDKLVDYYKARGFVSEYPIEKLSFSQKSEICEWLYEGYELTKPVVLYFKR